MGVFLLSLILVTFVAFVAVYLLFKKVFRVENPKKKPLFWLAGMLAMPLLYAGTLYVWFLYSSSFQPQEFNVKQWAERLDNRYEYVDDLVESKVLLGKTSPQVKAMLGEPDNESDSTLTYYIGYSPKIFMNSNPDWLELELENGRVESIVVVP